MSQRFVEVVTSRKIIVRGLLWYIMFFFIVRTRIFALDCSDVKGCICRLQYNLHISCESQNNSFFNITFVLQEVHRGIIQVYCYNSPKWVDFHVEVKSSAYNQVEFYYCDILPSTTSLSEITQMLGVTSVISLIFANSNNVKLMKHHLNGFDNLNDLYIKNSLTFCDRNLLANLPNLTLLRIEYNNINFIPAGFFNHVAMLDKLSLNFNNLQSIEPGTFDNLKFLTTLYMHGNNFTKFPLEIFDQLTTLEDLSIGSNNLISLSENIFAKLANLKFIDLHENNFTELPKDLFRNNAKLQEIYFYKNRAVLTTLPREYFSNFTVLSSLWLFSNGFVTLPEDLFWGTISLILINLSQNRLKSLPQNIFRDAKQLIFLDLDMNELEELPKNIFKNTNRLQKLNVSHNRISSISRTHKLSLPDPVEISLAPNMKKKGRDIGREEKVCGFLYRGINAELHVVEIWLRDTFQELYALKELNMEDNNLASISDPLVFPRDLKVIRFSHNYLTLQFLNNCLSYYSLEQIYLDHNNISGSLNLQMSDNLQVLDMKYNKISILNLIYLGYLSSNIHVDLRYNKIKHIHLNKNKLVRALQNKRKIVNILLDYNPIICDCSLYNYLRYLDGRLHSITNSFLNIRPTNLTCHSPKWLKNVKITDLRSRTFECKTQDTNLNIPCARECDCTLRPEDKEWRIDCSGKNLTQVPRDVKDPGKPYKLGLDFSGNMLKKMPNLGELNLQSARLLDLSYNNISEVSKDALPVVVEVLKLHNNNISRIHSDVLELLKKSTNLTMLTLHENPWECDCEAKDFLNFIQTKYVNILNLSEVTCYGMNYSILNMTMDNFCPGETELFIGLSVMITIVLIVIVGIIISLFRFYQRDIKVWLFMRQWCLCFVTEKELDKNMLYDAFISYSHKDEDFVVNELVPMLEGGPKPFKLCLHYRDWLAGEWIPEQIAKSVENSRRTIVVLSPNFLESIWGRMEFRTAHSQALNEGRTRVVPILYSDIGSTDNMDPELKAFMSMNTYIKWGDPWFWDKLKYALPHPPKSASAAGRKIFENYQLTQSRETTI